MILICMFDLNTTEMTFNLIGYPHLQDFHTPLQCIDKMLQRLIRDLHNILMGSRK